MAGGLSTVAGTSPDPAGIVSRDSRMVPTRLLGVGKLTVCRELRIREDRLAYMPLASVRLGVASHASGA
jgi:hypothetical protein